MVVIRLKRAYEPPSDEDGHRVLVDRFWPRGLAKADARIHDWWKEAAPSDDLRRWFDHRPERFERFAALYEAELQRRIMPRLAERLARAPSDVVTLVYAARDARHNHAVVLQRVLNAWVGRRRGGPRQDGE